MARMPCPCQSSRPRAQCCGRYIDGTDEPPTALACMRSRYTAYCEGARDYLLATWHPATRPQDLDIDGDIRWLGLKVHRVDAGGEDDAKGIVEFTARLRAQGRGHRLHEVSRFVREAGRWCYLGPSSPVDGSG
ncbi:MAG: YchJ family protein [Gammaproteobacteria bacterium]|jgi:SEC-C motif-containing protein